MRRFRPAEKVRPRTAALTTNAPRISADRRPAGHQKNIQFSLLDSPRSSRRGISNFCISACVYLIDFPPGLLQERRRVLGG